MPDKDAEHYLENLAEATAINATAHSELMVTNVTSLVDGFNFTTTMKERYAEIRNETVRLNEAISKEMRAKSTAHLAGVDLKNPSSGFLTVSLIIVGGLVIFVFAYATRQLFAPKPKSYEEQRREEKRRKKEAKKQK